MSKKKGFGKFLLGASIGAGLGMLFAPKTGKETREDLKLKAEELINKAKNINSNEVKEDIECKINEIMDMVSDLDKEKVLKIAKNKAKEIENAASELVDYAVEKGTPVLEKSASVVREKAIKVTKDILNKLEQEEK